MAAFSAEKLTRVRIEGSQAPVANAYPALNELLLYFDTDLDALVAVDSNGVNKIAGAVGVVSSVALAAPAIFTVTGSPVTSSGTLTLSLATEAANSVWAGPTTGSAAAPTFRALVAADIPSLSATYQVVSGRNTPGATGYSQLVAAPSTSSSTGVAGQIAYDSGFFYVCVATNTWVRAAILTF